MVATDIAARGIHIDGIDLVIHADPPAEHKAYVHRSGRTARGGADGVVVTLQTKAQARDVTAMMRKADITPHSAVAVDADSDALAEIAGPPAPRVTVARKVSELVRPEDRLVKNDRPGAGRPREGRPRRDREQGQGRDRDRGPRTDRPARADRFESRPAPDNRGSGDRNYGDRQDRRENRDNRGGNDWWPSSGRSAQQGTRGPGSAWRSSSGGGQARPQAGGRPQSGGQPRPRAERTDRPQAGGHFSGSSGRSGYSAGRGAAGKRRDDAGQGRHF
jgi:superfamily II DNA/RNA helicase